MVNEAWVSDVIGFWFDELGSEGWFRKDVAVDRTICDRFSKVYEALTAGAAADSWKSAQRALATVIVLDQFPRNMFRGTPQAFATDALACKIADGAIARGLDKKLAAEQRVFLYMPFEHSEDAADQVRAVELISALGSPGYTRFALAHKRIIDRFGRFPHRNAVLGRPSTPEEEAFLNEPGSGF